MLRLLPIIALLVALCPAAAWSGRIGGAIQSPGEALEAEIAAAERGDIAAIMTVADALRLGTYGPADMDGALDWYEKGVALNDINATYWAAILRRNRAKPGDHTIAVQQFEKVLALCAVPDANCTTYYVLRELAVTQREIANYTVAMNLLRQTQDAARQMQPPDEPMLALTTEDIGMLHYSLGQYEEAVKSYLVAQAAYEKLYGADTETYASVLLNRANATERLGRYAEAIALGEQALAIFVKVRGPGSQEEGFIYNNIGWAYRGLNRFDESYSYFEKSLPILKARLGAASDKVTYLYTNMGIVREKQGRHREAIALNMRALSIMKRFGALAYEPMRWTLESLSNSYAALGDRRTAILFAKMAVNTQQQIKAQNAGMQAEAAQSLAKDWQRLYQSLADLLISEGRIAEAQFALDLLKQQELVEFVRRDATQEDAGSTAALTRQEQELDAQLDSAMAGPLAIAAELESLNAKVNAGTITPDEQQRITTLEADLDQSYETFVSSVDTLLRQTETESDDVRKDIEALNLDYAADRQEMLRGFAVPTVLLQAASMGDSLNLFLTSKDVSIHRRVAISRAELSRKVFDALSAIESRDPGADALLAELYDLLIKPVEADLKAANPQVVMLNLGGFLRYLPFAALRSDHGYLIEDYALALDTPAARTKFEAANRRDASAAGFGVTLAHAGFSPLPGVAKELKAIFKGAGSDGKLTGTPVLDTAFTAESLKDALKQRPMLLHVASHFKFVPGNETDSFLLLGDGAPLTLAQIRKTRGFRFGGVDLLTLSACETAKGGDGEGDEVESFGAIAQMNGASAVMATLWPIADEPSGQLMADFYAGLVDDGLDKAQALRRAQIAMLRGIPAASVPLAVRGASDPEAAEAPAPSPAGTQHPYYWSPYILMGNWL